MPEAPRFCRYQTGPDGVPWSPEFNDRYHSRGDAAAEKKYVYCAGNRLGRRWRHDRDELSDSTPFTICELGLGLGINFLSAWMLWRQRPAAQRRQLNYLGIEACPLEVEQLQHYYRHNPVPTALSQLLLEQWPTTACGVHRLEFDNRNVQLTLFFSELPAALSMLGQRTRINCWFMDGFSPARNPAMWSKPLCRAMAGLSTSGTTLSSYSVAAVARSNLRAAGFQCRRQRGFAAKSAMLSAKFSIPQTPSVSYLPQRPQRALVVGAGLAGCHIAAALAGNNIAVEIIEAGQEIGSSPAVQPRSIIYPLLRGGNSSSEQLSLTAYQFSLRHFRRLAQNSDLPAAAVENCGLIALGNRGHNARRIRSAGIWYRHNRQLVRPVSSAEASEISGLRQNFDGLFFPQSGWIDPSLICRNLVDNPGIEVRTGIRVKSCHYSSGRWHILNHRGDSLASAEVLVLACASSTAELAGYPQQALYQSLGQSSWLRNWKPGRALRCVLSHQGYCCPPENDGRQLIGASYEPLDNGQAIDTPRHNLENFARLLQALPAFADEAPPRLETAAAGIRCHSIGRRPLVGAWQQGLYLSCAFGGRGVALIPFCSQLLADRISGQNGPCASSLENQLSPQLPG